MAGVEDMIRTAERSLGITGRPNGITEWYSSRNGRMFAQAAWSDQSITYWAFHSGNHDAVCFGRDYAYTVWHAQRFSNGGQWHTGTAGIRRGDIVFFDWAGSRRIPAIDHVALVTGVRDGIVFTIEGNTSDRCRRRARRASSIVGYGRPNYTGRPGARPAAAAARATAAATSDRAPSASPMLKNGSTGIAVKQLQLCLNKVMRSRLEADGDLGPKTEAALKAFQKKAGGLEVDGEYGPKTAAKLHVARNTPAKLHVEESRAVNTLLYAGDAPVGPDRPLNPGGDYELRVALAPYEQDSLVVDADEASFDSTLLPPTSTGHWLDVVVSSGDVILDDPRRRALFLPLEGSSWTCACTPGGPHECAEQERDPYVRMPLHMPERACVAAVEVAIYYGAAVVHAQALTLPVGVPGAGGPSAKVTYSLTSSFSFVSLSELAARSMSVLLDADHDGNHRMYVNGVRLAPFTFTLSDDAAFNAMSRARELLFRTHLYQEGGEWYSRYDKARQEKADDEYEEDLRQLAAAGAGLFAALFPDPDDSRALQQMLAHEGPPIVSSAKPTITADR